MVPFGMLVGALLGYFIAVALLDLFGGWPALRYLAVLGACSGGAAHGIWILVFVVLRKREPTNAKVPTWKLRSALTWALSTFVVLAPTLRGLDVIRGKTDGPYARGWIDSAMLAALNTGIVVLLMYFGQANANGRNSSGR